MEQEKTASGTAVAKVVDGKELKTEEQQQPRGLNRAAGEAGEQVRASKRTRRERTSTAKDRISKIPPPVLGKRSSVYRGVTRHRWTGRFEAHLWDKSTWNQSQNKKGKQVYLGAYDDEEAAARAYDLAALKYWGPETTINFPVTDYTTDIEEMQNVSREEYLASLRRKSSGFSRGVSKYRGVARHHHNGRWEARIGRVFGNKYLYLGTYSTQEEAAAAYDMAAIEYRGLNAVTNFDLSRYIKWLRPGQANNIIRTADSNSDRPAAQDVGRGQKQAAMDEPQPLHQIKHSESSQDLQRPDSPAQENHAQMWVGQTQESYHFPSSMGVTLQRPEAVAAPTALGLLWQSTVFKQMLEKASAHANSEDNMGMTASIFPGLDEEPGLAYEEESLPAELPLPLPLPFPTFSPGFAEAQEVWNSLGGSSLLMRSPISV